MIHDPFLDLTALPELEHSEEQLEERPDPDLEFWAELESVLRGPHVDFHQEIITPKRVCVFDDNGDHIQMSESCPHFNIEDEEGRRIRPGWTVQQR